MHSVRQSIFHELSGMVNILNSINLNHECRCESKPLPGHAMSLKCYKRSISEKANF